MVVMMMVDVLDNRWRLLRWNRNTLVFRNEFGLISSPQQSSAISAETVGVCIDRGTLRTRLTRSSLSARAGDRIQRRPLHHILDRLQRRSHGLFAGLGTPKIVLHFDEEIVRRRIRYEVFGVVIFRFGTVGAHICNSSSKYYEHNRKREVALCGMQMFAQNNPTLAIQGHRSY